MKRVLTIVVLLFSLLFTSNAEVRRLPYYVSLLTCDPGDMLYTLFGHTAIRVKYHLIDDESEKSEDYEVIFNYGTFDFSTSHFYLKFAKGLLPYQLSAQSFDSFRSTYRRMGVSVYEERLNLDSLQMERLLDALEINYLPENRTYLYNFLFDNCATRVRDLFERTIYTESDTLTWNEEGSNRTFWNLLDDNLDISPWVEWGIHAILGEDGNAHVSARDEMFLPEYLMRGVATATIGDSPLVAESTMLLDYPRRTPTTPWYLAPFAIFTLGLIVIVVATILLPKISVKIVATPLLFVSGLLGCLITFLAFTKHPITFPNWNILWAFPLNLVASLLLFSTRCKKCVKYYLNAYIGLLIADIPILLILHPAMQYATLPLIALMIYLSYRIATDR